MYSVQVVDHFEHPRNVGELERPDVLVKVENPACGDVMELALKIGVVGAEGAFNSSGAHIQIKIADVRFRTKGCVTSIACGSVLTEMMIGKSLRQIHTIQREQIVDALGGLTPESMHGSYLAMDALGAALKRLGGS